MSFIFSLFDVVLTTIMLFDTLGIIYQFRKEGNVDSKEYRRLCFSWIFFLAISSLFSCSWKGFFGTLIRLIILAAKIYVTIPILGGTLKIHKFLIEDGNAEKYYNQVVGIVKSKLCKGNKGCSSRVDNPPYDTAEPERSEKTQEPEGDTVEES